MKRKKKQGLTRDEFETLENQLSRDLSWLVVMMTVLIGSSAGKYIPLMAKATPAQKRAINRMVKSFFERNSPWIPPVKMWTRVDFERTRKDLQKKKRRSHR